MTVVRFVRYLGWILFLPLIKIWREKCLQVLYILKDPRMDRARCVVSDVWRESGAKGDGVNSRCH